MLKHHDFQLYSLNYLFDYLLMGKKRILLTLHPDADLDSLCSNFVLKEILEVHSEKINRPIKVDLIGGDNFDPKDFEGFEFMTKEVIKKNYKEYTKDNGFDILIALDIPRVERISKFLSQEGFEKLEVLVIDHHASNTFVNTEKCNVLLNKEASSTSEMIAEIMMESLLFNRVQSSYLFIALYLGIWSDTKGLNSISSKALKILSRIKNIDDSISVQVDLLIQKRTKIWTSSDFKLLPEAIQGLQSFEHDLNGKKFKLSVCVYENALDVSKVLDVLSKTKNELLVVAQKNKEKGSYWIEILSWLPEEYEMAKEIAIGLGGGGHANRAGAVVDGTLSFRQLKGRILYHLRMILNKFDN